MSDTKYSALASIAERQHGLFTRQDALEAGLADSTITNGLANGRFRRILPTVYAMSGSPESARRWLLANVLSMPALAAVSHRTAAVMWELIRSSGTIVDLVTTRWDRVLRDDVVVHESKDLIPEDIARIDGVPVTSAARTVVDLGATSPWAVEWALEAGIRKQLFTLADVAALVSRVARRGRRGVGVIRPLLEARRKWDSATDSALEDLFRRVVDEVGLPQPQPQYAVEAPNGEVIARVDFAYPEHRLLIELDSEAYHMDRLAFRRDRFKQNGAVVLGWTMLRYTWWDLVEDPLRVASELRSALGGSGVSDFSTWKWDTQERIRGRRG